MSTWKSVPCLRFLSWRVSFGKVITLLLRECGPKTALMAISDGQLLPWSSRFSVLVRRMAVIDSLAAGFMSHVCIIFSVRSVPRVILWRCLFIIHLRRVGFMNCNGALCALSVLCVWLMAVLSSSSPSGERFSLVANVCRMSFCTASSLEWRPCSALVAVILSLSFFSPSTRSWSRLARSCSMSMSPWGPFAASSFFCALSIRMFLAASSKARLVLS